MSEPLLVGVDTGLTNTKAAAFTPDGETIAVATRETPSGDGPPGRDDQDHDALWEAVADTIATVTGDDAVDPESVAGVGVAGHGHGLYALDADGSPVVGIKSTDSRAMSRLEEWRTDGTLTAATDRLGWEPFGADPFSLLAWLKAERPAVYSNVETVLFCKDVITHRLTGRLGTDTMEGSVFYGPDGDYDPTVFNTFDISEAFDALPRVVESTSVCGEVTESAAAATGLPTGTPVAAGLHDVGACALGAGAIRPGQGVVILGTWGQSVAILDDPDGGKTGLPRRFLGNWIRYRGIRSGTACVDWFVDEFGDGWRIEADERGVNPYVVYNEAVADAPVGAGGVIFHPYLSGSTDYPEARGGFYGLTLDHSGEELLRGVYEGVAIAQCTGLADLSSGVSDLRLTGGGARSEVWSEMFADIHGNPVSVPDGDELGARGVALCAGVAADLYEDYREAASVAVDVNRTHEPDPETVTDYRHLVNTFERVREDVRPTWKLLNRDG